MPSGIIEAGDTSWKIFDSRIAAHGAYSKAYSHFLFLLCFLGLSHLFILFVVFFSPPIRLSFYSGHASFGMYCMLFLAVSNAHERTHSRDFRRQTRRFTGCLLKKKSLYLGKHYTDPNCRLLWNFFFPLHFSVGSLFCPAEMEAFHRAGPRPTLPPLTLSV